MSPFSNLLESSQHMDSKTKALKTTYKFYSTYNLTSPSSLPNSLSCILFQVLAYLLFHHNARYTIVLGPLHFLFLFPGMLIH